eukprot:54481-Chlamydomonas_euryale.AAC.1
MEGRATTPTRALVWGIACVAERPRGNFHGADAAGPKCVQSPPTSQTSAAFSGPYSTERRRRVC